MINGCNVHTIGCDPVFHVAFNAIMTLRLWQNHGKKQDGVVRNETHSRTKSKIRCLAEREGVSAKEALMRLVDRALLTKKLDVS